MDLLEGEYEAGGQGWANDQVRAYEASGGREANTLFDKAIRGGIQRSRRKPPTAPIASGKPVLSPPTS